jgi:hypothetical protein
LQFAAEHVIGTLRHNLDTLQPLDLALVLRTQDDLDGARRLHERALAIREARLGEDHPDTARSPQNLAAVVGELDNQR